MLSGTWDGPLVDVDFPDDAGFLRLGPSYVVAAQVDSTTGKLYSKVRYTFSNQPGAGMCPGEDPIITRMSDGSPVDTAILSGMKGRWNKALVAFLVPSCRGHGRARRGGVAQAPGHQGAAGRPGVDPPAVPLARRACTE